MLQPLSAELRNCVVCGAGSHRTDWLERYQVGKTLYVACDNHNEKECQEGIAKAEAKLASATTAAA